MREHVQARSRSFDSAERIDLYRLAADRGQRIKVGGANQLAGGDPVVAQVHRPTVNILRMDYK